MKALWRAVNEPTAYQAADLFSYPSAPGWKARATSQAAAEAIKPRVRTLRDRVLYMLPESPRVSLTADEIAALIDETVLSVRPRVAELARMGLIEDSGHRRKNASGRMAICWRRAA